MFYFLFILFIVMMCFPVIAVIGFFVAFSSGFPIFFCQKRVGKNGNIFTMYKFRTMKSGAEEIQKQFQTLNEADGPVFKIRNDPRFTTIGRWLSHTGLDEIPQLFNVLEGSMALIGPRPLPVAEAAKLTAWQKKRHAMKPGIISPWIVDGYHTQTFDAWMKSDIRYMHQKSFLHDIRIFFSSVWFVCKLIYNECCTYEGKPTIV
jgi:lipopolysaccharide/colanic/teichoic acid biosynthesis glycosyltransferase